MKLSSIISAFSKHRDNDTKPSDHKIDNIDYPNAPAAQVLIDSGIAKAKCKDFRGALEDFDATLAIKTQPDSILRASTLVERSKVKTELKDKKGADEDFREAGEIFDRTGEGLEAYEDANLNYNSGNYKMALKSYNRAISFLPSLGNVYYYRGITKEELDDYTGAMDDYSKNIEANASNQSSSYYRRAKIEHYKLKNDDAALDDYNKAIELDPSNAEYYTSRAILLDEYEAVKDLNRAIELDPPNAMNYFTRSLAKCTLEDFEGSVQDINRFIAMAPTGEVLSVADAYSFRGDVKNRMHNLNGALQDYEEALRLAPSVKTFLGRGVARYFLKNYDGAIEDCDKVVEGDPTSADAYYWKGSSEIQQGKNLEGGRNLWKALELGYELSREEKISATQAASGKL